MHDRLLSGTRRPRPRRAWIVTLVVSSLVAAMMVVGASPAAADPAPLVTEDGVGIRLDETALTGPALAEIETALQPFVDQMIYDGATDDDAPFQSAIWVEATSDLELSLDVLPPDGSRPDGGAAVHADITNIEIEYRMDPIWPWGDCSIWVNPETGTVDITASVDAGNLPATPLTLDPISATWDDDPDVSSDGICWTYIAWQAFTNWWDGVWDSEDPESTASKIENLLNDTAQGLIDDLWAEHVAPVLDSLESFGVTVNQLHTDDHGLIVTADTDATDLTIPGLGGPFDVSNAEDSGADSDINDLLANRANDAGDSHVIVSVHPNVVNQFLHALNQFQGDIVAQLSISASVEELLLPSSAWDNYSDVGWVVRLSADTPYHTEPTGADGQPQLQLPELSLEFRNSSYFFGALPVVTFSGDMGVIDLITAVWTDTWGPGFDPSAASLSVTRAQANADATQVPEQDSSDILPYAKDAIDEFTNDTFIQFVSLAPISIGGLSVDLCPISTCGRYAGDERYTETFLVN